MAKVKLGLKELTADQKIDQANTIKTAMTGNANFTTPNPTLAAYGTLITTAQDCDPSHLVLPGNPSGGMALR